MAKKSYKVVKKLHLMDDPTPYHAHPVGEIVRLDEKAAASLVRHGVVKPVGKQQKAEEPPADPPKGD